MTKALKKAFFCDTTVVYYKLHGHSLQKQAVRQRSSLPLALSNFVRGEYIRGYISGLIELYFAIKAEGSVEDGITFFTNDAGRRPRRLANGFQSTTSWLADHEDWRDVEKTLRRLGEYIRRSISHLDDEFPTRAYDPLRCSIGVLSFRQDAYDEDIILDFYEEYDNIVNAPDCQQCEFRHLKKRELDAAGIDLHSQAQQERFQESKGYVVQAKNLQKAESTRRQSPSCWYCDRLGDSIIALSCPSQMTILTGDKQSFPVFAEILGRGIELIPSLQQLKSAERVDGAVCAWVSCRPPTVLSSCRRAR